jgi:hypothetical protein
MSGFYLLIVGQQGLNGLLWRIYGVPQLRQVK